MDGVIWPRRLSPVWRDQISECADPNPSPALGASDRVGGIREGNQFGAGISLNVSFRENDFGMPSMPVHAILGSVQEVNSVPLF